MKDLSVNLFDYTLPTPLIVAGGAPGTRSGQDIIDAAKAGAGAVITEGVGPKGCKTPRPWLAYTRGGLLNSTSFSELTEEDWFSKEIPKAKKAKIPIIVGIDARFGIEALQKTTRGATEAGADILYCAANDPTKGPEHVKMIKEETNLPVVIKIGFHNAMETIGKPLVKSGADGIIAIDAPWGMRINTQTGKPSVGGLAGIGHFSGSAILPLSIYSIYLLARTVKVPLIGGGGIHTGGDLAEMMMAGAVGGSTCSELILGGGLSRIKGLLNELEAVMDIHKINSMPELTGMTVNFLKNRKPEDLVTTAIPPTIDENTCTACGDCAVACSWNAITIDEYAHINESKCVGCALCVSICPFHAISLNYWSPVRDDHVPVNWRSS